uniref:Endonuclease_NS domain-containing protein n=1 Tax=Globodera pallida TaxID=36090 RepID=A0A183C6T1_GLOPA
MVFGRLYPFFIAAGSSSVGFMFGSQCSTNEWLHWVGIKSANADSAGTVVLAPQAAPTIPSGSTVDKVPPISMSVKVDVDMFDEAWNKPSRASEIMRFGYPGFDNLRTYEDFVVSYDSRNRTAHWVMEHLCPDRIQYNEKVDRSNSMFKEDESIHPYFRSKNEDYRVKHGE